MFTIPDISNLADDERYAIIVGQVRSLIDGERNAIANLANTASLLYHTLGNINWVGFYLFDGSELVLGPFNGKPACIRIAMGRGVCGAAASERRTIVVPDVHAFPGHIACDAASRSELVVPLLHEDRLLGVLDIDSPHPDRFGAADVRGCEAIAALLVDGCDWRL
ncbi:MAG: GAF domain-containing protein [Candidatus Kapabacteria bacterium]|nr:GAF domain-containing protein [Candidatus Kapabacteria bacterium]